jgi:tRNA A-37 threonylcarbamoyl transferase component Bud32
MSEEVDLGLRLAINHDFSGETVGQHYKLNRRIGVGGTASIYAATVTTTMAAAAVKVLHPEHNQHPELVRRFLQEGQLAAQIRHPCLVPAHDLGWIGGRRYTVFELVEGRSLAAQIAEGALPWERTVPLMLDLLAALGALHDRGVTHRDISPNNCMIEVHGDTERGRLLDLGYARVFEDKGGLVLTPPDTSESMIIWGSEGFVAPERLRGHAGDYKADIFSMGALWAAMLNGQRLLDPHHADPVSVAERIPLPAPLRAVLVGALDVRAHRHENAASMAEALRAAVAEVVTAEIAAAEATAAKVATAEVTTTEAPCQRQSTRRVVWLAPALGLLMLPAWFATHVDEAPRVCPPVLADECPPSDPVGGALAVMVTPAPLAPIRPSALELPPPSTAAPAGDAQFDVKADDGPIAAPDNKRPPRPRFDLRAALAKCKPHPTTRLEVKYEPAGPLKINDDPPQGEMGRCVADVLQHHPPRRAVTLTP